MDAWIESRTPEAFKAGEGFARAWVDIETKKVPAPYPAWPYKKRWSVFMVGLAYQNDTDLHVQVYSGTEAELIDYLTELFFEDRMPDSVVYSATRGFDELVLEGRFTNARRPPQQFPGPWPHLPARLLPWKNVRKEAQPLIVRRYPDVESAKVPDLWSSGDERNRALVAWHCYKDVAELLLRDPYCVNWLKPVVRASLAKDYGSKAEQETWVAVADSY